jgi:hypothetical protein
MGWRISNGNTINLFGLVIDLTDFVSDFDVI